MGDELAQETFLTAWVKLASLREPRKFRGWLKQLAYRHFLHTYRRQKLERSQPAIEVATGPDHADTFALDEELSRLLSLCSPIEQEVLILSGSFEFTYDEIATIRGIAAGTVKSHVHRARQKIKQHLESEPNYGKLTI